MTVADLIAALTEFPQDAQVLRPSDIHDDDFEAVESVRFAPEYISKSAVILD